MTLDDDEVAGVLFDETRRVRIEAESAVGHGPMKPMSLDYIRELAADERAIADKATQGPFFYDSDSGAVETTDGCYVGFVGSGDGAQTDQIIANGRQLARSRTAVPALCDAVEGLLAVVDALPRCEAAADCGPATRGYDPPGHRELFCDHHGPRDPLATKYPFRAKHIHDLPYAAPLRALLAKGAVR